MAEDRMPGAGERPNILVLGLGNLILRDDGAGIHAVRQFQELPHRDVLAVDVGTHVFSAVHLLEQADRVVALDAMQFGGKPGTVYVVEASDLAHNVVRGSLHELGLSSMLHMLRGPGPEVIAVGVEPEKIELGTDLSTAVQAAVPRMVKAAEALTSFWLSLAPEKGSPRTDLSRLSGFVPFSNRGRTEVTYCVLS